LGLRGVGFEDLPGEEPELVGVELLGLLAVKLAEEQLELMLELLVEVGLVVQAGQQLADEPVGRLDVVGQRGLGIGRRHATLTRRDR
jgi:hypothetical protein